jgi:hypothetical protein
MASKVFISIYKTKAKIQNAKNFLFNQTDIYWIDSDVSGIARASRRPEMLSFPEVRKLLSQNPA